LGRRRRKKIIKIYKPKIPKVFTCPVCGSVALNITIDKKSRVASVVCGVCGLKWNTNVKPFEDKIDIYHRLFDEVIEGGRSG